MTEKNSTNVSFPLVIKKDEDEAAINDMDDDASLEDINNLLSMPLPSLTANKLQIPTDPNDEFLRLTTMVRAVYFSYLHKCLLANYILCYKEKSKDIPCVQLKKCADQMELTAVQSALEASLYRQNMLKLISDVKSHTSEKKAYKNMVILLETPAEKVDIGVQTNNSWADLHRPDNIQSVCITSNCEELSLLRNPSPPNIEEEITDINEVKCSPPESECIKTASPTVNSTCFHEGEHSKFNNESDEEQNNKTIVDKEIVKEESENIFDCMQDNSDVKTLSDQVTVKNEDENSQDSLLQHMEDMFCESDDSSDLTTLIEKHSGVTKANIDKEITEMCLETDLALPQSSYKTKHVNKNKVINNTTKMKPVQKNDAKSTSTSPVKYSFSYYKEMKSREAKKLVQPEVETVESKQRRRRNSIWFVERVHQVSKLKAKMTELSLTNYRKHGRVKQKFIELFGESDEEEMMPDSPICIEEHLTACKERIAPWIVQELMPYYNKNRIKDRALFKIVAKHIADMLIIENTFPEQDCVSKYIDSYFKNKQCIKTKQDVYL